MAITDINISEKLEAGAPSIKYTGNMDPNMQMASAPDPMDERNSMANMLFNKNLDQLTETELIQLDEAIANSLADGGRAHFGLGSIIKKITKPIKKLAKSPIGKLGLGALALGMPFGAGGQWFGKGSGFGALKNFMGPGSALGEMVGKVPGGLWTLGGAGALTAASAFEGMGEEDVTALKNDPAALRTHLERYYRNVNSDAIEKGSIKDVDVEAWVNSQMYSTGGRVGLRDGTDEMTISTSQRDPRNMTTVEIIKIIKGGRSTPEMFKELMLRGIDGVKLLDLTEFEKGKKGDVAYSFDERLVDEYDPKTGTADESFLFKMRESNPDLYGKYTRPREFYGLAEPTLMYKAKGGRIGFAYGPDQTAQAAGIMEGLPTRNNAAGVKELDLRDSGGFIPPVGIKEKADDIPAMLSNNEFVFTADAVRAAGGGSVEKGAQVMYDTMKNLENKVV